QRGITFLTVQVANGTSKRRGVDGAGLQSQPAVDLRAGNSNQVDLRLLWLQVQTLQGKYRHHMRGGTRPAGRYLFAPEIRRFFDFRPAGQRKVELLKKIGDADDIDA